MRVLLTSVAHERWWPRLERPGLEPLVLLGDGGLALASGAGVDRESADIEVAWGTSDLFDDGAPLRPFFGLLRRSATLRWFQSPAAGYDGAVRTGPGATLRYLARPDQYSQQLGETVRGAVARQAALLGAARFAVAQHAAPGFGAGLAEANRVSPSVPAVTVTEASAGTTLFSRTLGQFDEGAWTELLLFLFLTALTGAVALIETRRLGLSRRMLATPTTAATVIAGEAGGRVLIACLQAAVIIFGSALLFGVNWGQPAGVAAVVILFALVGAGAGVFLGTLFRNEQQAIGVSLLLGLGLGALGGCMVPLEVFSPVMRRVAHITPQAWGNDAFARLVGHGASIAGILPQLGILAAYAVVLLGLAAWRLRRVLSA